MALRAFGTLGPMSRVGAFVAGLRLLTAPVPRSLAWGVLLATLAALLWLVYTRAWIGEDAFITFRTVDQFVHGNGLRWNVDERVQAYTHPLWMLAWIPFYATTRSLISAVVTLGLVCTGGAYLLLAARLVERFYDGAAAEAAAAHFRRVVQRGQVPDDVPEVTLALGEGGALGLLDVIRQALGVPSNGEARRLVQQGAVKLDGEPVRDPALRLAAGAYLLRAGKRRYARVTLS